MTEQQPLQNTDIKTEFVLCTHLNWNDALVNLSNLIFNVLLNSFYDVAFKLVGIWAIETFVLCFVLFLVLFSLFPFLRFFLYFNIKPSTVLLLNVSHYDEQMVDSIMNSNTVVTASWNYSGKLRNRILIIRRLWNKFDRRSMTLPNAFRFMCIFGIPYFSIVILLSSMIINLDSHFWIVNDVIASMLSQSLWIYCRHLRMYAHT